MGRTNYVKHSQPLIGVPCLHLCAHSQGSLQIAWVLVCLGVCESVFGGLGAAQLIESTVAFPTSSSSIVMNGQSPVENAERGSCVLFVIVSYIIV